MLQRKSQNYDLRTFTDKALNRFSHLLSDKVFKMIQEDRKLMREYLRVVQQHGLDTTNKYIGKQIKSKYNLSNNIGVRNGVPESTLILSHQEFI